MGSNNYYFDFSYQMRNICNQTKGRQLFNIPSTRSELISTPYNDYTKNQLDMRRKVEILKYNSAQMSTQTNSLTKAQKWKNLVSGREPSISATTVAENQKCIGKVSSSSCCDVPGPIVQLYEDVNVPLYNYKSKQNIYSIYPDAPLLKWSSKVMNNVSVYSGNDDIITKIMTRIPSDNLKYVYSTNIPLAIYLNILINDIDPQIDSHNLLLTFESIKILVYYNSDVISTYDVTNNIQNSNRFTISRINKDKSKNYDIRWFLGNVSYNNIELYNEKQYIFDIKLYVKYSLISEDEKIKVNESYIMGNYLTTTDNNYNSIYPSNSLNFVSTQSSPIYQYFSFSENFN